MRRWFASLLLPIALAGCGHAAVPRTTTAQDPTLSVSLRALTDDALDYPLSRLARDVEQLFARGGEQADVAVIGHEALHVVLPHGMRKIPWPALLALDGLAPAREQPEWSADFRLPVAPSWIAAARERILDETVARVRDRLVQVLHQRDSRVHREGDRVIVEVPRLSANARARLVASITARPRLTFHLLDAHADWMFRRGELLAQGGLTLEQERWSSNFDLFWRAADEASLRLFVDSLRGDDAVPPDHRLVIGEVWRGQERYFRTFFVLRRIELSSEDLTEVHLVQAAASKRTEAIGFTLTPWGSQRFADVTARNAGAKMIVLLEPFTEHGHRFGATVLSDAVIDGPVKGGKVDIRWAHDNPSREQQLAIDAAGVLLQLGNLPAELVEIP
jgi:preprotein translocase subunit SecD